MVIGECFDVFVCVERKSKDLVDVTVMLGLTRMSKLYCIHVREWKILPPWTGQNKGQSEDMYKDMRSFPSCGLVLPSQAASCCEFSVNSFVHELLYAGTWTPIAKAMDLKFPVSLEQSQ